MLAASVTDHTWHDTVAASGGPWFFAAEAVLIYLEPPEVSAALAGIGRRFPGSPLALERLCAWDRSPSAKLAGGLGAKGVGGARRE